MPCVVFRLYSQLNEHLPPDRRQKPLTLAIPEGERVRDALRGLEVDPGWVGMVLVNGEPAALDRLLVEGDRVAVYPPFTSLWDLPPS